MLLGVRGVWSETAVSDYLDPRDPDHPVRERRARGRAESEADLARTLVAPPGPVNELCGRPLGDASPEGPCSQDIVPLEAVYGEGATWCPPPGAPRCTTCGRYIVTILRNGWTP